MPFNNFLDGRKIPSDTEYEADICIIGSGPAGVTLANELLDTKANLILLEAGGLSLDPSVDQLSQIVDAGREYHPEGKRLRYFGGTANHWGGHCVPLEPDDFEKKDWIDHSGWPISYASLVPYYHRAHEVLDLGAFEYDPEPVAEDLDLKMFPFDRKVVKTSMSKYNRLRFGLRYGDALNNAKNVRVFLYSDASEIVLSDDAEGTVSHIEVQSIAKNKFRVKARYFVVATGGIENARILLMSNKQRAVGLGNHADVVGRFFMDHLAYHSGLIVPRSGDANLAFYLSEIPYRHFAVRAHLALPEKIVRQLRIPKFRCEIEAVGASSRYLKSLRSGSPDLRDILQLVANPYELGNALKCDSDTRPSAYLLMNFVEQTPNPASRITLADARDALGRPQTKLNWKLSRQDHDGIVKSHRHLALEVGKSGFGRMKIEIEPDPQILLENCFSGSHHMGTTRMSSTPSKGVADENAKVYHTNNLYIAGSSLFPTSGYANPTLTIVAVTIKLADYIRSQMQRDGVL